MRTAIAARSSSTIARSVLLAALILLQSIGTAQAAPPPRGVNFNPLESSATGTRGLDLIQQSGADTIRLEVFWSDLEPSPPAGGMSRFDSGYVSQLDRLFDDASRRHLRVVVALRGTPCWASSAPDDQRRPCVSGARSADFSTYPPTHSSDYGAIAAWVARRWGQQMAALEVWNEPNVTRFLFVNDPAAEQHRDFLTVEDPVAQGYRQGADGAQAYTQLLQAAYPAVKAAAPYLPVLAGALAYSSRGFLHRLYLDGIHGFFDAMAIHPYDNAPSYQQWGNKAYSFIDGVPWVHDEMVANGDGDKTIWLTEFGWPTCAPDVMRWCVSEERQASKLTEEFQAASCWPYLGAEIIYLLRDPGSDPNSFEDHMGLLRNDWSPKPAWNAFGQVLANAPQCVPPTPSPMPDVKAPAPPPPAPPSPSPAPVWTPRRHPPPGISLLRVRRMDARHIRLALRCRAERDSCQSRILVVGRDRRHTTLAKLMVTLRPQGHIDRIFRLRRRMPPAGVRVYLYSGDN